MEAPFGLMIGTDMGDGKKQIETIASVIASGAVGCHLASSFGSLTKESFKRMDKEMKVVIGYTLKCIKNLRDRTWSGLLKCMNSNRLLKPKAGSANHRTDRLTKSGTGVFKTDGSPSQSIINEIRSWFARLVSDSDVLKDTNVDIKSLARMVATTGASVDSFGSFFHKSVHEKKDALNVSVLRFPDIDRPYFKIYRIHLIAFRDCTRDLFVQKDHSGITGEFNEVCYCPVQEVLDRLRPDVIKEATKEAEDLFK